MKIEELLGQMREAMTELGIMHPPERALYLAMAKQESSSRKAPGDATELAALFKNPFGVHWEGPRDEGRYEKVTYDRNQFDASARVDYRVYASLRRAIKVERINKILRPAMYAGCKQMWSAGYPEQPTKLTNWHQWVRCIAAIHCDENHAHVAEVYALWMEYREQEIKGVAR